MVEADKGLESLANAYASPGLAYRHTQGVLLSLKESIVAQLTRPDF